MLHDLANLRTPSFFGSSLGPAKHRTTGPRNDLTGILVCRRSVGFTDNSRVVNRQCRPDEPSGAQGTANCAIGELRPPLAPRKPPPSLFGSSPSVSRTLSGTFGRPPEPPGSRIPPGIHRTPPGVHERSRSVHRRLFQRNRPLGANRTTCTARTTPVVYYGNRLPTEPLRKLTGTSGFYRDLFGEPTEANESTLVAPRR